WTMLRFMFEQVIDVALLQHLGDRSSERIVQEPRQGRGTNLKVHKVGLAVVAHDDILALMEIDVCHPMSVHDCQQTLERRKEIIVDALMSAQRMACNVASCQCIG